ncbi:zinc finger, CCHC-type containing protein [Tanacetum coccineum]
MEIRLVSTSNSTAVVAILLVRSPALRSPVKRTSKYGESNASALEDQTLRAETLSRRRFVYTNIAGTGYGGMGLRQECGRVADVVQLLIILTLFWGTQRPTIKEDYFVIMSVVAMKHMTSNFAKLDKFEGVEFTRWQKKIYFFLSSMSVVYVLTTPIPEDGGDDATDSLEAKYMADDASSKKFLVSNFTNYKMTDSRPVMEQYNKLLDFKYILKQLKEELTLVELGSRLRIEESLRVQDSDQPKGNNVAGPSVVNMVEHNNSTKYNDNKVLRPSLRIPNGTEDNGGSVVPKEKEAINDEMDSIMGNNTWVLVDLPPGCKPLSCKWIFKRKLKVDGTIEKFKARLVIRGFRQKSRIKYFDTYAPVVRISTIRLLIAMASIHNLIIPQMDVKTTFLNYELEEEVYMNQRQGFIMPGNENKDMGEADAILVSTPMDTSKKLMPSNGQVVSQLEYSRVIGCLMYAMTCTRPDIAFAMGKLSRYTSNPGTQHWQSIQRASEKQTCITGSTMESEFVALELLGKELNGEKTFYLDSFGSKPIAPSSIHYDKCFYMAKALLATL